MYFVTLHYFALEKTWAYLTIKQLLEKSEVTDNITIKSEMKERALELSLKVCVQYYLQTFNNNHK